MDLGRGAGKQLLDCRCQGVCEAERGIDGRGVATGLNGGDELSADASPRRKLGLRETAFQSALADRGSSRHCQDSSRVLGFCLASEETSVVELTMGHTHCGGSHGDRHLGPCCRMRKQQQLEQFVLAAGQYLVADERDGRVQWLAADGVCGRVAVEGVPDDRPEREVHFRRFGCA